MRQEDLSAGTRPPERPDGVGRAITLEREVTLQGVRVPVRLGGLTWGELNAARDNAVLVCHYYTGTMRAAGRNPDGTPAWWAPLIGPGRAVDTEKFFVVCLNSLANVQARDPGVVTTGPASLHADGQPWGARFPAWDLGDLHALQLELMHDLGVERWHAVIGPSMGGMQALHWAARTPELAPRVAAVAVSPRAGPVLKDLFGPMLRDIAPAGGLEGALRLISYFGFGADGIQALFTDANFSTYLRTRLGQSSLEHILDLGRMVQGHDLDLVAPPAELFVRWVSEGTRLLTVNFRGDQFFPAAEMRTFARATAQAGVHHTHVELDSVHGHMGCLLDTRLFAPQVQALLHDQPLQLPTQTDLRGVSPHA